MDLERTRGLRVDVEIKGTLVVEEEVLVAIDCGVVAWSIEGGRAEASW